MAQSPTVELPKRLPLALVTSNRGDVTTKDTKLVNCYLEKMQNGDIWIYKRPGLAHSSQPPAGAATGRGIFNWLGDIYSVFGNKLYKNGAAISGTVDTTNGVYRFDQCLGATPKMQLGNGVKAYNYDGSNGLVAISDVNFPAAFVKGWAYLDGTTYIMTSAAAIQGSNINDPTTWNALNTITAQIDPDSGMALSKQLNYTIALKTWTTEVFYDAANATGSPLGTYPGARVNWGCAAADSVQNIEGALLWLATSRSSALTVVLMDQLKAIRVSTPPVERLLNGLDLTTIYSWQYTCEGHRFYILTSVVSNLTLAYDLDEMAWYQWTDSNGNYVPIVASTFSATQIHYVQHESDGYIYTISPTQYTDQNATITVDVVTPNFDGGTRRRKLMNYMGFVADQVTGSTLQIRSSDDDYQTWSNFRTVDLGTDRPFLTECGTFTRRAHHLRHACPTAFRLQAVDLQLDIGTL